jgi:hypothetical protein
MQNCSIVTHRMPQHTYMHALKPTCDARSEGTQRSAKMKDQQRFAPVIDSQTCMLLKAVQVKRWVSMWATAGGDSGPSAQAAVQAEHGGAAHAARRKHTRTTHTNKADCSTHSEHLWHPLYSCSRRRKHLGGPET